MKPVIVLTPDIGYEYAAVSFKKPGFPLSVEKPLKINKEREVKDHIVEVAKIIQGSSKTKQ
jgi:hypothetical protein